jgi:HAD superfamily hydrolase (TIGR01509 family)
MSSVIDRASIAAICFDLDGTLVDSEGEAADSIALALEPLGRPLHPDERKFVVGHGFGEIYKYIHNKGDLPLTIEAFEDAVFAARVELFKRHGATILPGAREIVRSSATRFPLALVTGSTRREAELMLEALAVKDCFQITLCAGEYPVGKPSPDPYRRAAAALGLPTARCLAIEDSTAGITSAVAAGMSCIAVRAGNRYSQDQSMAHVILDTLHDLPGLL